MARTNVLAKGEHCVVCEAKIKDPVEQTYYLLLAFVTDTVEELVDEMCFYHRRRYEGMLEDARRAEEESE